MVKSFNVFSAHHTILQDIIQTKAYMVYINNKKGCLIAAIKYDGLTVVSKSAGCSVPSANGSKMICSEKSLFTWPSFN